MTREDQVTVDQKLECVRQALLIVQNDKHGGQGQEDVLALAKLIWAFVK